MGPENPTFDKNRPENQEGQQQEDEGQETIDQEDQKEKESENQESSKEDSSESQSSPEDSSPEEGAEDPDIQDAKEGINEIWENNRHPEDRMNKIKERVEPFLNNLDPEIFPEEEKQKIERNIEALSLVGRNTGEEEEDKKRFTETAISALEPLLKIKEKYPRKFEDAVAKNFNQNEGFTPINRVLSYGYNEYNEKEKEIHLHAPPALTLEKEEVKNLYFEGIQEIAKKVYEDSSIKEITAKSSIVFNHPKIFERLGFTVKLDENEEKVAVANVDRDTFLKNPRVKKILDKINSERSSSGDN